MKILKVSFIILIISVLFLSGCSSNTVEVKKPVMNEGAVPFSPEGACTTLLVNGELIVEGDTNLMAGTNGIISVLNSNGSLAARQKFTQDGNIVSHKFEIKDDWTDIVYGYITYGAQQGDKQPKDVINAYGKKFENLQGQNVIWDLKGDVAVFQSEPVRIRG